MPVKLLTVVDPDHKPVGDCILGPAEVGGSASGYRVEVRTLHGGLSDGVQTVRVDNGKLAFTVLPTRGMGIWKAWLGDEEIGWKSPVAGPVHPKFVPLSEPSGLGWLDGFDELFVRCGLENNGAPEFEDNGRLKLPLHGRIANKPASRCDVRIDGDKGEIVVAGVVNETRFHFAKLRLTTTITTQVGTQSFIVRDEIENLSASPATAQMLYHINFGLPLVDAGSQVVAPVKQLVPRTPHAAKHVRSWNSYSAGEAGFEEQVYFFELASDAAGMTQVLLKNAHGTRGVSLRYNTRQLPCFSQWKNTTAAEDGYVTGLEPGTNFPNPKSFEEAKGRVIKLGPGEKQTLEVELEVHGDAAQVSAAEEAVKKLQAGTSPVIHEQPLPDWCA